MSTTLRLLIVEDSEQDVLHLKQILSEGGYAPIFERVTGAEELSAALEKPAIWDMCIANYNMAHLSGPAILSILREKKSDIPVIMISSEPGESIAVEAMKAGAQDYIAKHNLIRLIPAIRRELHEVEIRRAHQHSEAKLREAERRFSDTLADIKLIAVELDQNAKIIFANDFLLKLTGWNREVILGKDWFDMFLPAESRQKVRAVFFEIMKSDKKEFANYENTILTKEGEERFILWNNVVLRAPQGDVIGVSSIGEDITERKKIYEQLQNANRELLKLNNRLKRQALKDSHTGLYNHHYLEESIEREFERAKRQGDPLAVILIDLDYFKSINDVYGHTFGDLVLKQLAQLMKKLVRRYDEVIRYGGEEFIIICPTTDQQEAFMMTQRLFDFVSIYNFGNQTHEVKLKMSAAVVSYPESGINKGIDLISAADKILDKAKDDGGNRIYSLQEMGNGTESVDAAKETGEDVNSLKDKLENLTKRANQTLMEAVFAFAKTLEMKDYRTGAHVEKTVSYAREIASKIGLPKTEIEHVSRAAMLHDLGKIGVSEKILRKKCKLTPKERDQIRKHPMIAADIIRPIHFFKEIIPLILYHHERWDGKGYPSGLKGEEIPIGARIITIADAYEALTAHRPYRKAYSKKEALKIIKSGSGTQFDPKIVDVFLKVVSQKK